MNLKTVLENIDPQTARAFIRATRHVIDAMLIEGARVEQAQTPTPRDYREQGMPRDAPPGGWISSSELRDTAQRLSQALSGEKWLDGFVAALRIVSRLGGAI